LGEEIETKRLKFTGETVMPRFAGDTPENKGIIVLIHQKSNNDNRTTIYQRHLDKCNQ
jgi:hypothetical protein